jgi:hypothetical protein
MATGPMPKCHFVPELPSGSLKIFKFGIHVTLEAHNFVCMWFVTYMQRNHGDFWLLVVGNQIGNLTPNPYFGHNLSHASPF